MVAGDLPASADFKSRGRVARDHTFQLERPRRSCSAFYSRQASNAIVAIATSAVAIRYACDLTQLVLESENSPNMS